MTTSRQTRIGLIDELLEELAEQRRRLYVLSTYGVRSAGMRDGKQELHATYERLAELRSSSQPVH